MQKFKEVFDLFPSWFIKIGSTQLASETKAPWSFSSLLGRLKPGSRESSCFLSHLPILVCQTTYSGKRPLPLVRYLWLALVQTEEGAILIALERQGQAGMQVGAGRSLPGARTCLHTCPRERASHHFGLVWIHASCLAHSNPSKP